MSNDQGLVRVQSEVFFDISDIEFFSKFLQSYFLQIELFALRFETFSV
jgi:hypothetical protein